MTSLTPTSAPAARRRAVRTLAATSVTAVAALALLPVGPADAATGVRQATAISKVVVRAANSDRLAAAAPFATDRVLEKLSALRGDGYRFTVRTLDCARGTRPARIECRVGLRGPSRGTALLVVTGRGEEQTVVRLTAAV